MTLSSAQLKVGVADFAFEIGDGKRAACATDDGGNVRKGHHVLRNC
jgi:hypothetical protein